jgi:hypothetical protein
MIRRSDETPLRRAVLAVALPVLAAGCGGGGGSSVDGGDAGDESTDEMLPDAPPDVPPDAPPDEATDQPPDAPPDLPLDEADGELSPFERSLVEMAADTWLRVEAGYIDLCDDSDEREWHAVMGCTGLLAAWSSGVWAAGRREMLLFGGGHADYAGNEVYAFGTATSAWTRLTEPSPGPYDQDPLADGRPVSRHTYDGLAWLSHAGRMLAWGGARSMDGNGTNVTWLFDPAAGAWTAPAVTDVPPGSYDHSTVYDPDSGDVLVKVVQMLYRFDPDTGAWSLLHDLGYPPLWPRYAYGNPRGALDSSRRLVWFVGGGLVMIYDIDADAFVTDAWVTTGGGDFDNGDRVTGYPDQRIQTGGGDVIGVPAPGLDYDVRADQMVAWVGGAPYALDLAAKTWTRRSGEGAPAEPTGTGTYGRWRYIDAYNVFILVTTPRDVYFYKNTAGP